MLVDTIGNAPNASYVSPTTSRLDGLRQGGNHIGAKARWACKKYGLFRSARYPPYRHAFHSPFQEAPILAAAGYLTWVAGRHVKHATGKSLLVQFRDMTSLWFGQMIDPPSY
jgi:hypothetical protein